MPRLGVNIDHIATLREARKTSYPDPVESLSLLKECAVDQVTLHLREDRRHIHDADLKRVIKAGVLPVNMEMAPTKEMVGIALSLKPGTVTLVPEKRREITTEGGLDLASHESFLMSCVKDFKSAGIRVSFFIDPDPRQVELAVKLKGSAVEFHTGTFCDSYGTSSEKLQLMRLKENSRFAAEQGLKVFAGHGIHCKNLPSLVSIREIEEYNIGHSIIARAVFVGLKRAITEIQEILKTCA